MDKNRQFLQGQFSLRSPDRLSVSNMHGAVELKAFPRHIGVIVFFVSLAIKLDVFESLLYSGSMWLVIRVFRNLLWEMKIYHRNIWNWLIVIRIFLVRWPLAIACLAIFWIRAPVLFLQLWLLPVSILIFDVLLSLFVEGKGYAYTHIDAEAHGNRSQVVNNKQSDNANRPPQKLPDDLTPTRNIGSDVKSELRQKYELRYDDWAVFESKVKKRLYEAMSRSDLSETIAELKTPHSLEDWYYIAAEDILFAITELNPYSEMGFAGLAAHDQWLNHLMQKEYEHMTKDVVVEQRLGSIQEHTFDRKMQTYEIIDAIERLGKLRDDGLLSKQEFEVKKEELLRRI